MKGQGRDCKIIVVFKIFFIFISGSSQNIWLIAKITITKICQLIQIELLDTEDYWSLVAFNTHKHPVSIHCN